MLRSPRPWLVPLALALFAPVVACSAEPPCPTGDLAPPARPPGFAVLLNDHFASAIALLDEAGEPITEAWIDSGTRASAASPGLTGDVVLPATVRPGWLAILERYQSDILTLVRLDGAELTQIDLRGDASGHSPNVQDVLPVDARIVLVSRYNPTFDPRTSELARGNDVVVVDLVDEQVVARIDLDADVVIPAPTAAEPDATTLALARPARMAMLEVGTMRRALVGLSRLSLDWRRTAPGALAVIDPDARQRTQLLAVDGLSGCATVMPVPGDASRALVLCTGDAFAPEEGRRATSGIARVVLAPEGTIAIDATWRASEYPDAPPPTSGLVAIDRDRAVVVADPRGDEDALSQHDRLVRVDLSTGDWEVILEAGDAFVLGDGAWDPGATMLLVPDAQARAVHRIDLRDGALHVRDAIPLPTCGALPPRQVVRIE